MDLNKEYAKKHSRQYTQVTFDRLKKSFDAVYKHVKDYDKELLATEFMIRAEMLKRDFTKRQLKVITFIFSFSLAYGKKYALIPQLQDFEVSGVSKTKIKKELDNLVAMRVIEVNKEESLYRILHPLEWDAPYHQGYNDMRSRELFVMNAEHANIDFDFRSLGR
jgi:hypothetical protein